MKRTESTKNQSNKRPRRSLRIGQQQFGPFWTENTNVAPAVSLTVSNTSSVDRLTNLPLLVVDHQLISFMGIVEVAMMREVNRYFEPFWRRRFVEGNLLPICIPYDIGTLDRAMRVIEILDDRKQYTKASPLVVQLGKGEHQITSSWTEPRYGLEYHTTLDITRNHITFVGKGKGETLINGGFAVSNSENITFKDMTVTNTSQYGCGIRMSNAKVELIDVALKGCQDAGLRIPPVSTSETTLVATRCEFANSLFGAVVQAGSLTSATFKNCVFHDNEYDGIYGSDKATIHLHGEATAIHSNRTDGIYVQNSAKVLIHLPSHHNTSYNNGQEDRRSLSGGTITNVE